MGIVNIAALALEANFLTNSTTVHSHGIGFEQMLGENLLPERPLLGQFRDQKQNASLVNDIVYRRVIPLPDPPSATGN